MVGDLGDMVFRLRSALPNRWFSDASPNLGGLLSGLGTPWAWIYDRVTYVIQQARILTATDEWLDLIAFDFLGLMFARTPGEPDDAYRSRIQSALFREAGTRYAASTGLQTLTGNIPVIFEPANCGDTGGYGTLLEGALGAPPGLVYGALGGWGSLNLPLQFFVTVARPSSVGVNAVAGYGTSAGGFGEGAIYYANLAQLPNQVTDLDIQTELCGLMPINSVAWLRII